MRRPVSIQSQTKAVERVAGLTADALRRSGAVSKTSEGGLLQEHLTAAARTLRWVEENSELIKKIRDSLT